MIAAMDFAKVFLTVADKRALRCASHATTNETRSLAERLMVMTRLANELADDVALVTLDCDEMRSTVRGLREGAERRNGTIAAQNGQLAGLIRRVRDLRVCLETGEFPDDDPDAFFAVDDGHRFMLG
jgi:hypothetical protein